MAGSSMVDFISVWQEITSKFKGDHGSIHGPAHWRRVEANGMQIASANGADEVVVRLFAVLHDSCRVDDSYELTHGQRAAEYAQRLRGNLFEVTDDQFRLLRYACQWHTHGKVSDDPTIGACWDADRLDLTRIGIMPDSKFMSTDEGRRIASKLAPRNFRHRS